MGVVAALMSSCVSPQFTPTVGEIEGIIPKICRDKSLLRDFTHYFVTFDHGICTNRIDDHSPYSTLTYAFAPVNIFKTERHPFKMKGYEKGGKGVCAELSH